MPDDSTPKQVYYVSAADGNDTHHGKNWHNAFATIQAAVNAASPGDQIWVAPGAYDETVTVAKNDLVIKGFNGRGAVYVEPSAAGAAGMEVTGDDITLYGIGIAGDDTAPYALRVGSQTASPARFRAYECKFEGVETAGAGQVALKGAGDVILDDCEFAWGTGGVVFDDNDNGFCTQVAIRKPKFHNLTEVHVGLAPTGGVANLELKGAVHDNAEDGTEPTDYIKVDRVGDTGVIDDCVFAAATITAAKMTIADGIKWGGLNRSEAGLSTARPA